MELSLANQQHIGIHIHTVPRLWLSNSVSLKAGILDKRLTRAGYTFRIFQYYIWTYLYSDMNRWKYLIIHYYYIIDAYYMVDSIKRHSSWSLDSTSIYKRLCYFLFSSYISNIKGKYVYYPSKPIAWFVLSVQGSSFSSRILNFFNKIIFWLKC